LEIVLEALILYGLGDEDTICPSEASRMLEHSAEHLAGLSDGERMQFIEFIRARAKEIETVRGEDDRIVEYLLRLPADLDILII
jgi:hypothetical protein